MVCMFYKNNISSITFVLNEEGVYQAEATKSYGLEDEARSIINSFISNSKSDGFKVDTVSISDFSLTKTGAKVDLQLSENKLQKVFEIKVKATKKES